MAGSRSLGVVEPGRLEFFDLDLPALEPGDALVETRFSGLSTGTELGYLKGTDPAFRSARDPELGVFTPGEGSRRYPIVAMGYMEVGEVVESRRDTLPTGTMVAAAYGHRSHHVLGEDAFVFAVPSRLDPLLGVYLAQMGPICANGLLHAAAEFSGDRTESLGDGVRGRNVLVTGAGVVGLMTALFAVAHGAREVAVADPDPWRAGVAKAMGFEVVEDPAQPWRWCKERWQHGAGDRGADLAFQCRGRPEVLHEALRALRPQGTVIDLAFYQAGAQELRLGEEFHHNGLTIRCAQIARVPRGLGDRWDRGRLAEETASLLLRHGELVRQHLVTDVVPIEEAPGLVTDLAARRKSTLQAVFAF